MAELLQISEVFDHYGYQWWVDIDGYYAAVGVKGQCIFVVPEKNLVAVFTADFSGKSVPILQNLLDSYIIPSAVSPNPLPRNEEEKERLDALQASISKAPTKEFIWTSENEGVAKNGVFLRTASPGFKFEYPLGSRKAAIENQSQVMRMKTPGGAFFSASVIYIPEGIKLEDFGPQFYASNLPNVQLISNKKITLKCGTIAYRTDLKWLWKNVQLSSVTVSAFKGGKCVLIAAHSRKYQVEMASIVESLAFE